MGIYNLKDFSRDDLFTFENDIVEELKSRDITESLYNINNVLRTVIGDYHPYFEIETPISGTTNNLQFYYDGKRNVITVQFSKI